MSSKALPIARAAARATSKASARQVRSYSLLARSAARTEAPKAAAFVVCSLSLCTSRRLQKYMLIHAMLYVWFQPARGVKTLDFAGTKEVVYERADWPVPKLQEYFKNDTLALIGYGSQGAFEKSR
jgi:ketol-acid reductoisomerase